MGVRKAVRSTRVNHELRAFHEFCRGESAGLHGHNLIGIAVQIGDEAIDGTIAGRLDGVRRRIA